jgi:hypothetical protein
MNRKLAAHLAAVLRRGLDNLALHMDYVIIGFSILYISILIVGVK